MIVLPIPVVWQGVIFHVLSDVITFVHHAFSRELLTGGCMGLQSILKVNALLTSPQDTHMAILRVSKKLLEDLAVLVIALLPGSHVMSTSKGFLYMYQCLKVHFRVLIT